jgi:DNA polymerase-3 subunit alpha
LKARNFKTKDSLVEHLEDCNRMGIKVVPPCVNKSDVDFSVKDGVIYFGLAAIKGCGGSAGEAISSARKKGGPFRDLFDFCERVDSSGASKAVIETLIKAGAFDAFGAKRSQLGSIIERAIQAGQSVAADRKSGQKSLFGAFEDDAAAKPAVAMPDLPELPTRELAQAEKEVLGFYLSAHPLDEYKRVLATYRSHTTSDIAGVPERGEVILGGMLAALKFSTTKNPQPGKPSRYVMFDLEDVDGAIRCILWPDGFAEMGHLVQPDAVLIVRGVIDRRGGEEANLIINELIPLSDLDGRFTSGIVVKIDEQEHGPDAVKTLSEIVRGYPGNGELRLVIVLENGSRVYLRTDRTRVNITPDLRKRLDDALGPGNYQLITTPPKPSSERQNGRRQFQRAGAGN